MRVKLYTIMLWKTAFLYLGSCCSVYSGLTAITLDRSSRAAASVQIISWHTAAWLAWTAHGKLLSPLIYTFDHEVCDSELFSIILHD